MLTLKECQLEALGSAVKILRNFVFHSCAVSDLILSICFIGLADSFFQ